MTVTTSEAPPSLDDLLAHAGWLRALAAYLVRDRADADDLVQETWVAALRSPPDAALPPRPWLAQVLRNALRSRERSAHRRRRREREAPSALAAEGPRADVLLAQVELQRLLSELVVSLGEPYRSTVVLRFFEGHEPSAIAARLGIPAGTVRWRLSVALERLRAALDARHGGDRAAWRALLVPLVPAASAPPDRPRGGAGLRGGARGALVGAAAATFVLVGATLLVSRSPRGDGRASEADRPRDGATAAELRSASTSTDPDLFRRAGDPTSTRAKRVSALAGVVLPSLAAADEEAKRIASARADAIAELTEVCVTIREKTFECKEVFASAYAEDAPPERRVVARKIVMRELVKYGSGPVEPRRANCAAGAAHAKLLPPADMRSLKAELEGCYAKEDCEARAACLMPILRRLRDFGREAAP